MARGAVQKAGAQKVTLVAVACLIAVAAHAHARLEKSTPADGSTLRTAPAAVEMTFSEPARLTALAIQRDEETKQPVRDLPAAAARTQRVTLPALMPGVYTLTWRAVAADGHISSGAVRFTVAPAAR